MLFAAIVDSICRAIYQEVNSLKDKGLSIYEIWSVAVSAVAEKMMFHVLRRARGMAAHGNVNDRGNGFGDFLRATFLQYQDYCQRYYVNGMKTTLEIPIRSRVYQFCQFEMLQRLGRFDRTDPRYLRGELIGFKCSGSERCDFLMIGQRDCYSSRSSSLGSVMFNVIGIEPSVSYRTIYGVLGHESGHFLCRHTWNELIIREYVELLWRSSPLLQRECSLLQCRKSFQEVIRPLLIVHEIQADIVGTLNSPTIADEILQIISEGSSNRPPRFEMPGPRGHCHALRQARIHILRQILREMNEEAQAIETGARTARSPDEIVETLRRWTPMVQGEPHTALAIFNQLREEEGDW